MAYFIPSYLQKRLLRYALSRLDLIEDDDLDLENLGLTFGQRSVVELRNVSIKVKKVADKANLPPSIIIDRASVRLLRLTVPADLHASGIVVEVEGVDVQVRILHEDQTQAPPDTRRRHQYGPNHNDKSNRPRLSSPPIHDPGGTNRGGRQGHHLEFSRVLPTSKDLAASFLESEPVEEKQELEAVIGSQSRLHESTMSSGSGDDSDIGMAAGLTLPSFVANFFQGVADRLSVTVEDINVTIQLSLSPDDSDISTFSVKVRHVDIRGTSPTADDTEFAHESRGILIQDVTLGLEADSDALSQTSSPRLDRSSLNDVILKSTHYDAGNGLTRHSSAFGSPWSSRASHSNTRSTDFATSTGLGLDRSPSAQSPSSRLFHSGPNPSASLFDSGPTQSPFDVDNKANAEMQATYESPSPESEWTSSSNSGNKLAESKLFTHEEAESMYMSAISGAGMASTTTRPMPGGWDWSDSPPHKEERRANTSPTASPSGDDGVLPKSSDEADTREEALSTPPAMHQSYNLPEAATTVMDDKIIPTTVFIQVLKLDFVKLMLPSRQKVQISDRAGEADLKRVRPDLPTSKPSTSLTYSTIEHPRHHGSHDAKSDVDIEAGNLTVDVDLRICKLVVRSMHELARRLPETPAALESPPPDTTLSPSIAFRLRSVLINFREASISSDRSSVSQSSVGSAREEPILRLSFSSIQYQQSGPKRKNLTVTKIVLRHTSTDVLYFVETVNVRDSIASSALLRPHDLSVNMTDGRIEVQLKPVYIVLDLLVMDEVLSRSGGLSSLIDLGNSIASTSTVKKSTNPTRQSDVPQRTVRFSDPHQRTRSPSDPSFLGSKINLRIGGSVIDLVGSETSMQVKSSALKLAWRDGQARVVIDGAVIEGPILPKSRSPTGVSIQARSLDIRYLDVPEETDLDRLLSLITPSSDKHDNDDDIMVDTLLRQRRKGGVLRLTLGEVKANARGLDWQISLTKLSSEVSKLSSVTKYLPEDDRPGILTFALINKLNLRCDLDPAFGPLLFQAELLEGAHINVPSLAAAQISSWSLARGGDDVLIGEVLPQHDAVMGPPMLMLRFVADEMEPTVRLKLSNTCLEYKVSTVIAVADLAQRLSAHPLTAQRGDIPSTQSSPSASSSSEDSATFVRKVKVSTAFRDSAIALHPTGSPAKGLFVLTDAVVGYDGHKRGSDVKLELRKASLLIINNTESLGEGFNNADQKIYFDQNDQIQQLAKHGFVPVGSMSSASAIIKISQVETGQDQHLDVEFRNNLLFLETCADSTQTLIHILSGLSPPSPPSAKVKYRTEIVPIQDMLASFTGNAFVSEQGPELGLKASQVSTSISGQEEYDDDYDDGGFMNDLYAEEADDEMTASYVESDLAQSTASLHIAPVALTAPDEADLAQSMVAHSMLDFRTEHFAGRTSVEGTAHRWDSTKNTYGLASDNDFNKIPLKVRIRDVHIIWNLFDGYDWQVTRDTISHAVRDIETKAMMRRPRSGTRSPAVEEDNGSVVGDVLFNSIYISIPANKDPRDLTSAINHEIDDMVSETGSYATGTTSTASPTRRSSGHSYRPKKLRLNRSKHHKMSFELEGVSADIVAFPPGSGEVESSIDVRVRKLEIFDHLPTSTWRKFATYMHEAGEREVDTSMIHLELLNVKPVADLDASEIVMKLTLLPLRLHVDQDALDFLTRFFEFKDDSISPAIAPSAPPFIQRAEVNPVRLRLDYKPKKVDYAGLRSGRTTEFMNFIILDRADMVLRRVILYGVSGFDRLGIMLNNIWSPDVRRNQLPTVLSGLAPVRPLVDVASGVRDLIAVPIREYKKDGRIVRSIQKGAIAFAKTTGTELVNLGAKLAIGTQGILQTAEGMLVPGNEEPDDETKKQLSLYADQPLGIVQGLRGAYASLERDLLLARDAIVAVPGEVMASDSATGAAKAVLKQSPTIILRPAIGATKAVGQTLLGAGNTLDRRNLRRIEDKYKRH